MSRSRSLLLVGALVAGALIPAAAAGAAPSDKANDRARAEHERIVAYWTPERMRAAIPRDFVRQADGSFVLATPKAKPDGGGGKGGGKPGGDSGGGDGTTSGIPVTSGSSWTTTDGSGGDVQKRTGKAYFRFTDAAGVDHGYVCSGSVVADSNSATSLVLTAAHCVYDAEWGFATYWMFIPDFDSGPYLQSSDCNDGTWYGCWTASGLVAPSGFTSEAGLTTEASLHDFAFAVVGAGGKPGQSRQLDEAVDGGYQLATGGMLGDRMSAFGYPAAGKYKGNDLTYCSGDVVKDPYNWVLDDGGNRVAYLGEDDNWGMACRMTGGSSGGPWITGELKADGSGGAISSLNSYGYTGINYMYGPVFDYKIEKVYQEAKTVSDGEHIVATPPPAS